MDTDISRVSDHFAYFSVHNIEVACKVCVGESRRILHEAKNEPASVLKEWRERKLFRREVSRLLSVAPHMIDDIGLTLDEASEEMARPFWRA